MQEAKKSFTFEEIRQKMMNYCVYQDRCHQEVEQKMREFLLIPEAIEEILMYLLKENYLNEERFTRSYIRGKFYIKNWGKNKIKLNLKQKGVSEKLAKKCFDEIDEKDYINTIKKTFSVYYAKLNDSQENTKYYKTIKFLLSKGFEYETIKETLENN
jgi:regulatory protein